MVLFRVLVLKDTNPVGVCSVIVYTRRTHAAIAAYQRSHEEKTHAKMRNTHTHIHTHTHTHIHIHIHIHTHKYIHTNIPPSIHACIPTLAHTHIIMLAFS